MSLLQTLRDLGALDGLDLRFAQAVGRLGGVTDERVLLAAALADRAPRHGHTRVELAGVGELLRAELGAEVVVPQLPEPAAWWQGVLAATTLVRGPDERRRTPLVAWDGAIYLDRTWDQEERLGRAIRSRAGALPVDEARLGAALDRVFGPDPRVASQRRAVKMAVSRRLTVITGGPGTGKTSVVLKLLDLLRAERGGELRVVLAAPTGKAAARLGDAVGREAATLHRVLGLGRRDPAPRHGPEDPLRADVVVVDEASMVDLSLMCKLVEAVPREARLVLLGDPDQLASVEVGSVLADLCAASLDAHVALDHTWRYAPQSGIALLASAIRAGDPEAAVAALAGVGWVSDPPADDRVRRALIAALLRGGYTELSVAAEPTAALAALGRFRLLCGHRRGPLGVEEVHEVARTAFPTGSRPYLVTANDPRLGVFNGDAGVVLPDAAGVQTLWLPGPRSVSPALVSAEPAYASTVHRSQGSEVDHVVVMLPPVGSPLLTRELLYTAVTRARESVVVVGSAEQVSAAVRARTRRCSGLAERLSPGENCPGTP